MDPEVEERRERNEETKNDLLSSQSVPRPIEDADSIKQASLEESTGNSKTTVVESEPEMLPSPTLVPASEKPVTEIADFSVYTTNQKRAIIFTASLAGFYSPLSGSIYYPALDTIAKSLNVTNSAVNLTVTTYMVCLLIYLLIYAHHTSRLCKDLLQC